MASPWNRVGQAASVMQFTGVDAFGLVNMIVQAAHTARRNRDLCQKLSQRVQIVAGLLGKLDIPVLTQHQETRRPLEQLRDALISAYWLVRSCTQRQENRGQLYQMFTGTEVASKLREAQEEIDFYIKLIPMINLVAATAALQATNDEVHEDGSNDAAPSQSRNGFSLQHVTQSLTLEELQPQGPYPDDGGNDAAPTRSRYQLSTQPVTQSLTLEELQPQGSSINMEARRNTWQVVTEIVKSDMFDQMGRYLTYVTGTLVLPGAPPMFSYEELYEATRGFSKVKKLGGYFYRGFLHDRRLQVAIKRIFIPSFMGVERVKVIAEQIRIRIQLRHRSIVQLIGWCHKADELLLVYELLMNGSLQDYLSSSESILTWPIRYRIIDDICDALLYMQKECSPVVVHGNIKSSNVMVDSSLNARLGDFGCQAIILDSASRHCLTRTLGTRFTTETDVYRFGVLLLEIASGRPPILPEEDGDDSYFHLVRWLWELHGRGALLDAADPGLHGEFDADQMERVLIVGLWCVHEDYRARPSINQAKTALCRLQDPPPQQLELGSSWTRANH